MEKELLSLFMAFLITNISLSMNHNQFFLEKIHHTKDQMKMQYNALEICNLNQLNPLRKTFVNESNQFSKTDSFPFSSITIKTDSLLLKYDSEKIYFEHMLKRILDNPYYSENNKLFFLESALADGNRDALEFVHKKSINFWRTSEKGKELIDKYFERQNFESMADPKFKYKYFEFKTKNYYPDAHHLIRKYFESRPSKKLRYKSEGDLIFRLAKIGEHEDALIYLKLLIDDYIEGNAPNLDLGNRQMREYDGYAFDYLCFSDDEKIRMKATDLLFYLLLNSDFSRGMLYTLTSHLDYNRHLKMLEKHLKSFESVVSDRLTDTLSDSQLKRQYREFVPGGNRFFSFLLENSKDLGETQGYKIWNLFKNTMRYWEFYQQSFETSQITILENSFRDKNITQDQKLLMLKEARLSQSSFVMNDHLGDYRTRYLKLIFKTFPERNLPIDIIEELDIGEYIDYQTLINTTDKELEVELPVSNLKDGLIDKMIVELDSFAKKIKLAPLTLTEREKFQLSLDFSEATIYRFLTQNEITAPSVNVSIDPEYRSYERIFNIEYKPVLLKQNINGIEIKSIARQESENDYTFKVYGRYNSSEFNVTINENQLDWYDPLPLVRLLNTCLAESQSNLRFVEVFTPFHPEVFVLAEPNQLISFLEKYNFLCRIIQ